MEPIIAPIKSNASGPQVVNLQNALFVLLERGIFRTLDAPNRPTMEELQKLAQALNEERAQALFGEATYILTIFFQIQQGLGDNLRGVVEEKTAAKLNEILKSLGLLYLEPYFVVRGTVRDSNGKPSADMTVRAFDRDLRKEEPLGNDATTDAEGRYEIRYTAAEFNYGDSLPNPAPDLMVRVLDANAQLRAESPIRFNAGQEESIDLVITVPAPAEWEIITQTVLPLLNGQGRNNQTFPLWELNDDDLSFIVKETGIDHEQVRLWLLAAKMSHEVELISHVASHQTQNAHTTLESIIFYGWFRDGQPQTFSALIMVHTEILTASLEHAIQARYIPEVVSNFVDHLHECLNVRRSDEMLRPAPDGAPASLGDLLNSIPDHLRLNLHEQRLVAMILHQCNGRPMDISRAMEVQGLDQEKIADVLIAIGI